MKLNEKGLRKIQQWQSTVALGFPMHPSEIEFEPDDFQKVIVLSIEEAKEVLERFKNYYFQMDLRDAIKERIKQAEIKHLKYEIAQWKKEQAKDNCLKNQFLKTVEQEKKRKYNEL